MSETTETTDSARSDAAGKAAGDGLRDVPANITDYKKFVAEGGNEHNQKVVGHEAAVAAAKAAGILPAESETAELQAQEKKKLSHNTRRFNRLHREIGARDSRIADLEKQLAARANGAAPAVAEKTETATGTTPRVNGRAPETGKQPPPRPLEKDFKTYGEFVEALTDWKTDRKLEAAAEKRAEESRAAAADEKSKAITDAHNARVDEAKTRYPDWDKAFKGLDDNSFTNPMVVFIFESDKGPDVTYYLATHRDELERISKLSPLRQAAALGKIEDQFTEEKTDDEEEDEAKVEPEPKPKKRVSSAPPPAKPLGGKGGSDDAMPDPKDFKAYEAWSKRQAARGVKR